MVGSLLGNRLATIKAHGGRDGTFELWSCLTLFHLHSDNSVYLLAGQYIANLLVSTQTS